MNHALVTLFLAVLAAAMPLTAASEEPEYAGSDNCRECHEPAWNAWRESHHFQAMLPATEDNVRGDFSGVTFEYGGIRSRFFRRDGKFFVETDNAEGALETFEIAHTFGFHPLQQYLIGFDDGRYQALNIVWDSRPEADGGQRWIHLYPDTDNPVKHDDPVHWTGAFQNWNSRCAVCHSTGLEKNYSAVSDRYDTRWQEINVACEACHGPASNHLAWARGDQSGEDRGFAFSLADRGQFVASAESHTRQRADGARPTMQVQACAACHARRGEFSEFHPGGDFDRHFRLALLEQGLYFPDGQIRDEVYVYGSFLQSRMHAAGVVCSNCHDPHSNRVYAQGNALCSQCHAPDKFDTPSHHHHPVGSTGAECVSCHMPATTYMVVDDRRDHRFGIPEPALTAELGLPNACNRCHEDRSAQWAIDSLAAWKMTPQNRSPHARVLHAAWQGEASALPGLLNIAGQAGQPAIVRASAVEALLNYPSAEALQALPGYLADESAMLRAAAVRAMDWVPLAQRYAMLRDLIEDDSSEVRLAVARQLIGIPADQLPPASAQELNALYAEYLASLRFNADMPEEQMNLGQYHAQTGNPVAAEKAYRQALKLSPSFVPAMLNLADLYRASDMDKEAVPLLERAVALAPSDPAPSHALGLLKVRQGQLEAALPYLQQAADAAPGVMRYGYVYAVALWEAGQKPAAVSRLEQAVERFGGNRELVSALASYYQVLGESEKLQALLSRYPL